MRYLLVPMCLAGLSVPLVPAVIDAQGTGGGRVTVQEDVPLREQNKKLSANRASSRVTVILRDSTVKFAIQQVLSQAKLRPIYNTNGGAFAKRINVHLVDAPVSAALETILQGTGLIAKFGPDDETVMIRSNSDASDASESARAGTVSGRVTDSTTSHGLAGVTVVVRGTRISKTTNGNGEFTLIGVPAGEQTIEFKLVGYRAVSRTIRVNEGETATVNAVLRNAPNMLAEVVTTAIGQQQRKDLGYTVASLNVDSIRQIAPINSVTDLLENRVPGVSVQRTSGTPGDPARIRLRGASSISENNDPVIIVDGSRRYGAQSDARNTVSTGSIRGTVDRQYATTSPLDQIDPASIERIDVLRGPAAAAMYGPDAASGAIVITTKRGRPGPPVWNVGIQAGISEFPGSWPVSSYQWVTPVLGGAPALCIGYCGEDRIDSVRRFQALNDPYLTPLGRGSVFTPSVGVSGGSGKMTYNVTATSLRQRGILKLPEIEEARYLRYQERPVPKWMRRPDLLERRMVSANMQTPLNTAGTTVLNLNTSLTQEVQHRTSMTPSGGGGTYNQTAINYLQRLWVDRSQLTEVPLIGNPYQRVTSPRQTVSNSASITAQPLSWLSAELIANLNSSTRNSQQVIAAGVMPATFNTDESGGSFSAQTGATQNASMTLRFMTPRPIRKVRLNAGFNFDRERTEDQNGSLFGAKPGVDEPSDFADSSKFSRRSSEKVFFGYYLAPQLVLSERFNITPGFRLDQNGLSGENAKFNGWPTIGGSWLISDEPFFPRFEFVNELRLRGAFGVAGSQPTTGSLNRSYGNAIRVPVTGQDPLYGEMWFLENLGNTRLRPERTQEIETGFDLSTWNNRFNVNFTYSRKATKDAIVDQPIASSVLGAETLRLNVGDLENQATEIKISTTPIERKNISAHFELNFNHQQSLVKRLARNTGPVQLPSANVASEGQVRYVPGYPLDGIWMRPITGYNDLDGNGWIASSEIVTGQNAIYLGSTTPDYEMSIFPDVTLFKRITLAAGIAHVSGQVQSLSISSLTTGGGTEFVFGPEGFNRQVAFVATTLGSSSGSATRTGIGYVQKVDQTRLKFASVTMEVSPRVARLVKASSMRVSLRGNNLALWTNYIGIDPNVNGAPSNASLMDYGQLPEPREWSLNFSLRY